MKLAVLALALVIAAPPSGRPPIGPLERYDPKIYDFRFDVTLSTEPTYRVRVPEGSQTYPGELITPRPFDLTDAPIVLPLILQGTFSRIDQSSLDGELWLGDMRDGSIGERSRVESGLPHHMHLAVMPVNRYRGTVLRWIIGYRVQVFSSRIDDREAAKIPWPREWPEEVRDGLQPQLYIESDDPIFRETVERVSQGQLRMVPPYLAAKDLVRYCVKELQVVGNGEHRGRGGVLHGMVLSGAKEAAVRGRGTRHDLVCVCVAMLRAAGIPARPVIGVEKEEERNRKRFVSWGEFYLPEAGWVPFDPDELRGSSIRTRDVREPWKDFGTLKDLNERIPLSFHFIPPRTVETPMNPAVWGWDPRPEGAPPAEQRIQFSIVSRGRGVEDPE